MGVGHLLSGALLLSRPRHAEDSVSAPPSSSHSSGDKTCGRGGHGLLSAMSLPLLQMRRSFTLPLQPLMDPSSPRCQKPVASPPRPGEMVTENPRAAPFLQEKPSSHALTPPQLSAMDLDESPPTAGPLPRSNVGKSTQPGTRSTHQWFMRGPRCADPAHGMQEAPCGQAHFPCNLEGRQEHCDQSRTEARANWQGWRCGLSGRRLASQA